MKLIIGGFAPVKLDYAVKKLGNTTVCTDILETGSKMAVTRKWRSVNSWINTQIV